jgi:glycyl-tRNA synthetase
MELEYFVSRGDDEKWHEYWVEKRLSWWEKQGVSRSKLKEHIVPAEDLSHYSKKTIDIMYEFPHGLEELEGIANRTDFDLGSHTKNQDDLNIGAAIKENTDSVSRLAIQDAETKEWSVPYVIEPSAGVERGMLAILNEAYSVEKIGENKERTVLSLAPHLSPIKAAIIPLKRNNEDIVRTAKEVKAKLQGLGLGRILLENTGNIGKSYRKHDEIGTPICITIDFDTLENKTITVRNRDTMLQTKANISEAQKILKDLLVNQ